MRVVDVVKRAIDAVHNLSFDAATSRLDGKRRADCPQLKLEQSYLVY
jgi:hypothetical protein